MTETSKNHKWGRVILFFVTFLLLLGTFFIGSPELQHLGTVFAQVSLIASVLVFKGTQSRNLATSPIFTITLVLLSFLFPISNSTRWGILLAYNCVLLLLNQEKGKRISLISIAKILNITLISILIAELLKKVSEYTLQIFSFGYDNAFHFAIYRYFRSSTWFPFGFGSEWGTDFGMFLTYPTGQSALWSFLAEPLIGNSANPTDNLAAYSLILATSIFLMIYLIFLQLRPSSGGFIKVSLFPMILSVLISFAFSLILFTNGFLPYFFGLLLLLVFVQSYNYFEKSFSKIVSFGLAALILMLVSPSILAFILLPGAFVIFHEMKKMLSHKQFVQIAISIIVSLVLLIIILWIQQKTTATYGWRQILAPGGIRQPSVVQVAAVFTGYLAVIVLQRKKLMKDLLLFVSVSGLISVGLLSSLTFLLTGSIQYYAVKQAYVALAVGSIVVCKYLLEGRSAVTTQSILVLVTSLVLILPSMVPKALNSGFMGTVSGVVTQTLRQENWNTQVVNANWMLATLNTESLSAQKSTPCLIFRVKPFDSDLNSRWLNSLTQKPNISNNCFAGFWNSGGLNGAQLVEKLGKLPGTFIIVTDSMQDLGLPRYLPSNISTLVVRYHVGAMTD